MTIQENFNLITEGNNRGSKTQLLKQAKNLFPDLITNLTPYPVAITILKNRGIITESTSAKKAIKSNKVQDWMEVFKTSINEEVKAIEKETSKEVKDNQAKAYDRKAKDIDNVYGQTFLNGYYTELKDPANKDKTTDQLLDIVAKNMFKDVNYYLANGQFGTKGLGFPKDKQPGLPIPTDIKGDHKSSGYGDLPDGLVAKIKANVKATLGNQEAKTGDPKKVKKMSLDAQSSKGVKKTAAGNQKWKTVRQKLKENEGELGLDFSNDVKSIFEKFKNLPNIQIKTTKEGKRYKFQYGTGYLTFITNKNNHPTEAYFEEDRANDFINKMKDLGFGSNIFARLSKLGNKSTQGYSTVVKFNNIQESKKKFKFKLSESLIKENEVLNLAPDLEKLNDDQADTYFNRRSQIEADSEQALKDAGYSVEHIDTMDNGDDELPWNIYKVTKNINETEITETYNKGDKVEAEVGQGKIIKGKYLGKRLDVDGKLIHAIRGENGKVTLHPKISKNINESKLRKLVKSIIKEEMSPRDKKLLQLKIGDKIKIGTNNTKEVEIIKNNLKPGLWGVGGEIIYKEEGGKIKMMDADTIKTASGVVLSEYGEDSGGQDMTWGRYNTENNDDRISINWDKWNNEIRGNYLYDIFPQNDPRIKQYLNTSWKDLPEDIKKKLIKSRENEDNTNPAGSWDIFENQKLTIPEQDKFAKFTIKVLKPEGEFPEYKGTIKRNIKGWTLYDVYDNWEDAGPFNSLESLMSYFDLTKDNLSGDYVKNLK